MLDRRKGMIRMTSSSRSDLEPPTDPTAIPSDITPEFVARVEAGHVPGTWGTSFMAFSVESRRFVLWSARAVAELARIMATVSKGPWVEVCSGDGSLAASLGRLGVAITATDLVPATGVEHLDVRDDTLTAGIPAALCVFPPHDNEVLDAVRRLRDRIPLILIAPQLDGILTGGSVIDGAPDRVERLASLEAELITRHDFCMTTGDAGSLRRHARAFIARPAGAES
jgi:hypothetical protein